MRQQSLALLLLLLLLPSARRCERFLLGYITGLDRRPGDRKYERPGRTVSGAISLAVERVNGRGGELWARGHSLHFEVAETYGEETTSIRRTAELWRRNITAYIGPQETCVHEARMAAAFNLPMISYFCTHQETSDKVVFPTFARTRPPDTQISKSVASVLLAFNWTQVSFLYLNSAEGEFRTVAATILETLKAAGVRVHFTRTWSEPYHHGYAPNHFTNIVADTYLDTRIYVILGYYYEHLGLMAAMEEKKLFDNGEYWVVGVDIEQYDADNPGKYLRDLLRQQEDANATRAFRSYLGVAPSAPRDMTNFSQLVSSYIQLPPFNIPNPVSVVGGVRLIRPEAAYLYDAVLVYSHALVAVLDAGGDPRNGSAIIDAVKRRHYSSAMGYMVYMDENGDAEGNYTLLARQRHDREPGEYGMYPVGVFTRSASGRRALPDLQMTATIDWVGGRPPIAEPPCGFRGEKCITHTGEIAGGIAGGLALVLLVVSLVLYRNWRYEQELDSLLWKVDWRDIQLNDENTSSSLGAKVARAVHPLIRTSQVSLSSNPDADFRYSAIYTQIGIYKGRVFAIKKVHKKSVDITRSMKKELKMMRDLRHDNLNAFIGACTDPPNICIVTEYCARGSLKVSKSDDDGRSSTHSRRAIHFTVFAGDNQTDFRHSLSPCLDRGLLLSFTYDILENEDVKLDNMFIASLVGDIIRGMLYLHESAIRVHGNLKTSNCLVDSRWVLKLADFGLHEFKAGQEEQTDAATVSRRCEGLLFRAPELLRAPSWGGGSQKADVYAFAMVLFALHARHPPWAEAGLAPADVVRRVAATEVPPFRPQLEALENTFDCVRDCLKECWSEMPEERPDFKAIRTRLRPLRKGMKPNIFDNMMAMMEKYANNLEALVDERTDQLVEEKKKTEALLFEMLPRSVAEQLRRGHKVEAESFDCVTIYFSDIVGFTAMSAESTPLQVVDFLNDLYTCFDSTIENYDVYKVETIGDAYMVVSGLPIRNGNEHAAEIASMSLHLLDNVRRFRVRHRPNDSLQLRIGIHSGPVCAGVVGLKMPRYCLFGDTVNTASRMESTGLPLKIHCSAACKRLLEQLGGYQLAERGLVCMKGKGEQLTYWLLGEEPRMRSARTEQRAARRAAGKAHQQQQQQQAANGCLGPRSSLKSRLARCSSLESPKRLRFGDCTEYPQLPSQAANVDGHPLLEVIADQSPCKSSKDSSSSCPCIENCCGGEGGGDGVGGGGGGGGFPPDRNHSEPALLLHYGAGAEAEAEAQRPLLTGSADGLSDSHSDADTDDGETPV